MTIKNKILLISPSIEDVLLSTLDKFDKVGMKTQDDSDGYPLGLAYLHSYLEKQNNEVETLFLNNYSHDDCFKKIIKKINEFKPNIVGFQVLTQNRVSTYRLIEYVNENYPEIKIVLGGIHATIMYDQLLKKYPFVVVVIGEGEITLSELSEKIKSLNFNLATIKGIAFNENGVIKLNPYRELIENLDELPFPKHEVFFQGNRKCGIILTARGCPFNCSFCSLDLITRRRVRYRTMVNVMAEIEWMIKKFPSMTDLWIQDDTFFVNNMRVIEFCDEIIKRGIKLNFICSARFKPISAELVKKIQRANFKKIFFGLESGDDEILKKCHKGINQKDVLGAIKLFQKTTIVTYAHLIVGLPGETEKSIKTTARLVQKIQKMKYIYYQTAYLLTVYPGTEVYEIAKSKGMMDDDFWMTNGTTPLYTAEHSLDELYRYKELLLSYVSPTRAFTTLEGFLHQYHMIPYHSKYIFSSRTSFKHFIYNYLKIMLREKNFVSLKKIYKLFTTMDKKSFSEFIKKIIIKTKLSKLGRKHKMSYSQSGEDLIIDFVLSVLKINKPNYLEIGSYDFRKINNTYLFYQQGLRGVCIEPDPVLYQRFKKSRPRDICLNIGISGNENGTKKFFLMKSKTLNTFSEEEAKKNEKAGYPIEKTIDIKIVSINKIIDENFASPPNIFSLDTEGLDMEILNAIDFGKFRPEIICVETIELNDDSESKDRKIIEYLKNSGYLVYADTHINTIFVDKVKWLKGINKKTAEDI